MLTLPDAILPVLHPFAALFRSPTWLKAQILLAGAILAPGQRTVAAALRVMGRSDDRNYARYHLAPRLGTPNRRRPSWMPSLWCAATCGWRPRVFHCPPPTLIYGKSRPLCTTD